MAPPTTPRRPAAPNATGSDERAGAGRARRRPIDTPTRCLQADCEDPAFSDGYCPLHGLQRYYRKLGAKMEAERTAESAHTREISHRTAQRETGKTR